MKIVTLIIALMLLDCMGCAKEADEPININVGKTLTIELDSNQTTGYAWQLAQPIQKEVLELVESKYITPETDLIGAGGKERWTFKAVGQGKEIINFIYVRPWEKDRPPAESQTFNVTVSGRAGK